jgi:uncharacterized membrane protein
MKSNIWKTEKRPVLDIPLSSMEIIIEITAVLGMFFSIYIIIQSWAILPNTIPTHFGPSGKPDGWGGKESLLLLPGLGILLIYVPMTILNRFPHIFNYLRPITEQNARVQYYYARLFMSCLKVEIVWLFAYMSWRTVETALGKAEGMGLWSLPMILILIFGTIGIYIYKSFQAR